MGAEDRVPNVFSPDLEEEIDLEGFSCRGTAVALEAGSERLGASVYEIPPGNANCPYHYHYAPGTRREGMRMNFRMGDARDYWDGERPPEVPA